MRPDHVEVYRDTAGKWRWRRISGSNGQTTASSAEAFASRWNAKRAARKANAGLALVVVP